MPNESSATNLFYFRVNLTLIWCKDPSARSTAPSVEGLALQQRHQNSPNPQPMVHYGVEDRRRSSNALVTTVKLEKAMAPPANTGVNQPMAARGIPTTL